MDKKIAGLLGAAAALTTMTSAQAAPVQQTELAPATSYGDLLNPIANAVPQLKADNARRAEAAKNDANTEVAQIAVQVGHHHHHHHHRVIIVRHRHHHHHHHHHD